jgi:hypothetical protein
VLEDFERRFPLPTRKPKVKTPIRHANGQRATSSTISDNFFELARREFQPTFYVLRDLCVVGLVLGLPSLDDEQALFQLGTTQVFTFMDGATIETQTKERRSICLLMSPTKAHKRVRKTRRNRGRQGDLFVMNVTPSTSHPTEFHTGKVLIAEQRETSGRYSTMTS